METDARPIGTHTHTVLLTVPNSRVEACVTRGALAACARITFFAVTVLPTVYPLAHCSRVAPHTHAPLRARVYNYIVRARAMSTTSVETAKAAGVSAFSRGEYASAYDAFSEAVRALTHEVTGDAARGLADCLPRLAEEQQAQAVALLLNRAACGLKLRRFEDAVRDTSDVLRLQPSSSKALFRRAQAYAEQGELQRAIVDAQQLAATQPESVEARQLLSFLQARLKTPTLSTAGGARPSAGRTPELMFATLSELKDACDALAADASAAHAAGRAPPVESAPKLLQAAGRSIDRWTQAAAATRALLQSPLLEQLINTAVAQSSGDEAAQAAAASCLSAVTHAAQVATSESEYAAAWGAHALAHDAPWAQRLDDASKSHSVDTFTALRVFTPPADMQPPLHALTQALSLLTARVRHDVTAAQGACSDVSRLTATAFQALASLWGVLCVWLRPAVLRHAAALAAVSLHAARDMKAAFQHAHPELAPPAASSATTSVPAPEDATAADAGCGVREEARRVAEQADAMKAASVRLAPALEACFQEYSALVDELLQEAGRCTLSPALCVLPGMDVATLLRHVGSVCLLEPLAAALLHRRGCARFLALATLPQTDDYTQTVARLANAVLTRCLTTLSESHAHGDVSQGDAKVTRALSTDIALLTRVWSDIQCTQAPRTAADGVAESKPGGSVAGEATAGARAPDTAVGLSHFFAVASEAARLTALMSILLSVSRSTAHSVLERDGVYPAILFTAASAHASWQTCACDTLSLIVSDEAGRGFLSSFLSTLSPATLARFPDLATQCNVFQVLAHCAQSSSASIRASANVTLAKLTGSSKVRASHQRARVPTHCLVCYPLLTPRSLSMRVPGCAGVFIRGWRVCRVRDGGIRAGHVVSRRRAARTKRKRRCGQRVDYQEGERCKACRCWRRHSCRTKVCGAVERRASRVGEG